MADVLDAGEIWTGHYSRREQVDGRWLIRRGVDAHKDQSYMLATVEPQVVERLRFPLGDRHKPDVREEASSLGLEQATIADSQDVCFLGGGGYRDFLTRMDGLGESGRIVDADGTTLGEHDGIAGFTPGQRRGVAARLNRAGSARAAQLGPFYVQGTDPETGTVTIAQRDQLETTSIRLRETRQWISGTKAARVQYRSHAGKSLPAANLVVEAAGRATLELGEPVVVPAPGQIAVLYDERDVVVGFGTIDRDARGE
jgi:tRNA-specific 2-thiouridylase